MKRLPCAVLLVGGMSLGAVAAANSAQQAPVTLNQRHIRGCMGKHMSTYKTVSYNDAKKICAAQLKAQNQTTVPPLASARPSGK